MENGSVRNARQAPHQANNRPRQLFHVLLKCNMMQLSHLIVCESVMSRELPQPTALSLPDAIRTNFADTICLSRTSRLSIRVPCAYA